MAADDDDDTEVAAKEADVGLFDGKTFTIALMNGDAILTATTCCMAKTATGLPVVYVLLLAGNHKAHAAALQQSGLSVLSSL